MDTQKRIDLIKQVAGSGGEIIGVEELKEIFESGDKLYTYDGFEPSGQMHIAQGLIRAINTNKMIKAGFIFRMYVADWFAYINNKMGGDMEKIQDVGNYFIEIWRASGMDLSNVEFIWSSDVVKDPLYWELVLKIAKSLTLKRAIKSTEIMGRTESDNLSAAQIFYPCMQIADVFHVMKCQVTQLGLDQRKANVIAREVAHEIGYKKPVVVSHGMLRGLGKPVTEGTAEERALAMKMSKSIPDSAIFMTDSEEDVIRKINKAYCPEGVSEDNPILDYCKNIIFEAVNLIGQEDIFKNSGGYGFEVKRDEKFGGDVIYETYEQLEHAFVNKQLFPQDLKIAVSKYINLLLEPVRKHFTTDEMAKNLLDKVTSYQITR